MTLGNALPFGLRDVKVRSLGADGATPGTAVDFPIARVFKFSETEDSTVLRGDDADQASHGSGPTLDWELENGGLSMEAYAIIAGGTVTSSGTTPNQVKTYKKLNTDSRPYFKVEGQSINDNGGDTHGIVFRAKANAAIEGSFQDKEFWVTNAKGRGFGSLESGKVGEVYDFVQNETATAIT
jgi:hypothetical protein